MYGFTDACRYALAAPLIKEANAYLQASVNPYKMCIRDRSNSNTTKKTKEIFVENK